MAQQIIRSIGSDGLEVLSNILDKETGKLIEFKEVSEYYDGTPMSDGKLDAERYLYIKNNGKYYLRVLDNPDKFLEKDTMLDMRNISNTEILLLKMGYYKGVTLNGYYTKGDTPIPINYKWIDSDTSTDDGGGVIETSASTIGRLNHVFRTQANIVYYGADRTGIVDSTIPIQNCINANSYITSSDGTYTVSNTIIIGNNKKLIFPGSYRTTIRPSNTFHTSAEDKKPIFAFNSEYNNLDNNTFQVSKGIIEGVTIHGRVTLDSNGIPTQEDGISGVDVTWTKDDIQLNDVMFRQLAYGCICRLPTWNNIAHWGIRINKGGAYQCAEAYHIFPSLGSIIDVDIQSCIRGINHSGNSSSSTLWVYNLRAEVNTDYTTPATNSYFVKSTSKLTISGYFEGGTRHLVLEGTGTNSQFVLQGCNFSRVSKDGVPGVDGSPILYNASSVGASLNIIGGGDRADYDSFIELGTSSNGAISIQGHSGGSWRVFKYGSSVNQTPKLAGRDTINYFNIDKNRGDIELPDIEAFFKRLKAGQQATGPFTIVRDSPDGGTLSIDKGGTGTPFRFLFNPIAGGRHVLFQGADYYSFGNEVRFPNLMDNRPAYTNWDNAIAGDKTATVYGGGTTGAPSGTGIPGGTYHGIYIAQNPNNGSAIAMRQGGIYIKSKLDGVVGAWRRIVTEAV